MPSQTPEAGQQMMLHETSNLIGKTVKSAQGEDLGKIHDIVLSQDYQQVSYVALSSGAVLGIGGKFHAIPWQALNVRSEDNITASISQDQIKQAAGFDNDNWPSQADSQLSSAGALSRSRSATDQTATNQGQTSTDQTTARDSRAERSQQRAGTAGQAADATDRASARDSQADRPRQRAGTAGRTAAAGRSIEMRRVSRLTGFEVKNPSDNDLGTIEDFVVNASDGRLMYTVISFGGFAGIGERYAAIPSNAIQIQTQNQVAILNATQQTLESIAYRSGEAPNWASNEYMQRARQLFPAAPSGTALGYVPPDSAQQADSEGVWGAQSQYGKSFTPGATKTIQGTVESVGCFRPEGAKAAVPMGLRLRVKTADGNLMTVHAGPIAHAEQQNFFVMPGDQISITGAEVKAGQRSVIVASELKKGSQTLQLRDQSGKPLWSTGGQAQAQQGMRQQSEKQQRPGAADQTQAGQTSVKTRQPQ